MSELEIDALNACLIWMPGGPNLEEDERIQKLLAMDPAAITKIRKLKLLRIAANIMRKEEVRGK